MVGPDHDTPDDTPDEGGTAPADLLQMWISGRAASAVPATSRTATAPSAPTEQPEPATEIAPAADPESDPESDTAPDTAPDTESSAESVTDSDPSPATGQHDEVSADPAPAPTSASAPAGRAPSSSAPWASTPPPTTYGRTAAETAGSGSGSGWWPYAETASPAPDPVDPPATVAEAGPDGLHDDVEAEWTSSDATAVADTTDNTTGTAAPVETAAPVAAGERPHWASFGEAQTAEEVLDRLGPGASLPGAAASRAAAPVSEPEAPGAPEPIETPPDQVEPAPVVDEAEPEADSDTDLSATTHWSLDDFEAYIRAQSNNELDSWMGSQATSPAPVEAPVEEPPVEEPPVDDVPIAEAPVEEPVEEPVAEEPAIAEPEPVAPAPAAAWTPTIVHSVGQSAAPAEPDMPADDVAVDAADDGWAQPDVEWDHVDAPAGTAVPEVDPAADLVDTPPQTETTDPEATQYAEFLREDETPGAPGPLTAAALEADPESGTGPLSAAALEAGAETPVETPVDGDAPAPADMADVPDDEVVPEPVEAIVEPEPEPEPPPEPISLLEPTPPVEAVAEPEVVGDPEPDSELIQAEHHPDPEADDYQEWHDDQGLRWVSHDGGYTWYSDDGQGWNAEIGEAIDVPAGYRPATVLATPSEDRTAPVSDAGTDTSTAVDVDDATEPAETSDPVDPLDAAGPIAHEHEPWPEEPETPAAPEAVADDVWPSTSSGTIPAVQDLDAGPPTQSMWPGEAPQAFPPTEAIPTPVTPEDADPTPEPTPDPVASQPPASADAAAFAAPSGGGASALSPLGDAAPATPTTSAAPVAGADEIPPFVEYKPRGAYRPLLGVLFVAAAILAVVAIFWAVTQGSQAATGIAVGVTGFALAFWWGLLSWTPTIVSVSGSILEVARGSDGERFDLRSSKLMIDVDDDTGSRNWRTTITRPNGTELVIPASAVDPDEFAKIVRHYRAETPRDQAQQVPGR